MHVEEWFTKRFWIAQTYEKGLEYAFLSKDLKQCGPFVYCKEFLVDSVWATTNKKSIDLYGFYYSPYMDAPVDLEKCRVLLRHRTDGGFAKQIKPLVKFLNGIEKAFGFDKTKLQQVSNPPQEYNFNYTNKESHPVYCLEGSKEWMQAPPMVSLYVLLMRCGMGYRSGDPMKYLHDLSEGKAMSYSSRDNTYIRKSYKTILRLIETKCECFKKTDNWPSTSRQFLLHEYSGIVSFSEGEADRVCKDWYLTDICPSCSKSLLSVVEDTQKLSISKWEYKCAGCDSQGTLKEISELPRLTQLV